MGSQEVDTIHIIPKAVVLAVNIRCSHFIDEHKKGKLGKSTIA